MAAARRSRVKIARPPSAHWRRNGETSPTGSNGRAALRSSRSRSRRSGPSEMNAGRNGRVPRLQRSPREGPESLGSDAKCNTPRRFDIGKVVQDLKECCHAILFASLGRRQRPNRHFAGRGGDRWGVIARALGRAKTTISRELQRNELPSGGYSPLHAAGAYQVRRRREAIINDTALYGDIRVKLYYI